VGLVLRELPVRAPCGECSSTDQHGQQYDSQNEDVGSIAFLAPLPYLSYPNKSGIHVLLCKVVLLLSKEMFEIGVVVGHFASSVSEDEVPLPVTRKSQSSNFSPACVELCKNTALSSVAAESANTEHCNDLLLANPRLANTGSAHTRFPRRFTPATRGQQKKEL
jgi:hypothetical protein